MSNSVNKPIYNNDIRSLFEKEGFELVVSMDCEGTNYDKNLENNVLNLERFLKLATNNNITCILFITPYFADMLSKLKLIEKIKENYKVIFGLHIHPDNLPEDIASKCSFIRPDEEYLASYSYEEQKQIVNLCMEYLDNKGIEPIQIYRGGCFSMNEDTSKILAELTDIKYESHNPYREQYTPLKGLLNSMPVYALSRDEELRLEFFTTEKLQHMVSEAYDKGAKTIAITHSYMLDSNDFHYERDGIIDDIHIRLEKILETIQEKSTVPKIAN